MQSNGWKLYWHPAFKEKFDKLLSAVQSIKENRPAELNTNDRSKLLKRILEIILEEIPQDPNHANYAQGNTLGEANRHWRRAKFLQRFRLFFRFSTSSKIIIYAWVNDENTLRQTGAKTDAYEVFEKRLKRGEPPTSWDDLLKQSEEIRSIQNPYADENQDVSGKM
jgi:toxin YhaV